MGTVGGRVRFKGFNDGKDSFGTSLLQFTAAEDFQIHNL